VELLIAARPLVPGTAEGESLVSAEPLSFWGGYDHRTGEIIDRRHPLVGMRAAGRILGLPYARGSSTTTAVLLEALRAGTAPAAILTTGVDTFFALAAIVGEEMFDTAFPVAAVDPRDFERLPNGRWLRLEVDGTIYLVR
jgi:predicted aconitase with swiveling domain